MKAGNFKYNFHSKMNFLFTYKTLKCLLLVRILKFISIINSQFLQHKKVHIKVQLLQFDVYDLWGNAQ